MGKSDETKSKEMVEQDLKDRENLPQMDESEKLMEAGLDQLQIIDSFDPAYEFEVIGEEDWAT